MQGILTLLGIIIIAWMCFCVYFLFKSLGFIINATRLYRRMIVRQDAMIKLLLDIRDNTKAYNDYELQTLDSRLESYEDLPSGTTFQSTANAKPKVASEIATDSSPVSSCPMCGENILLSAHKCKHCQHLLTDDEFEGNQEVLQIFETQRATEEGRRYSQLLEQFGIEFVQINAGSFMMGSPDNEPQRNDAEGPQHKVKLSTTFFMQTSQVTQSQWEKVMGSNPSFIYSTYDNGDHPVTDVTFQDVQVFISKLNEIVGDDVFRLPTEAEWEYACRAGNTTPFSTGETISTGQANYDGNNPMPGSPKGINHKMTIAIKSFDPNEWGLYDMHGNVWEWVQDCYHEGFYANSPEIDPVCENCGSGKRIIRGGSFKTGAKSLRSAARGGWGENDKRRDLGFRIISVMSKNA